MDSPPSSARYANSREQAHAGHSPELGGVRSWTRRSFLLQAGIGAVALPLMTTLLRAAPLGKQAPNILFAMADDWGWPHASAYGDAVVKTPTFDRMAREGILFQNAFVAAPTCTASRNAMLTGQYPWRLGPGANLWSTLPEGIPTFPNILEDHGYAVGSYRKVWGPGKDRERPAAGMKYEGGLKAFLEARPKGKPFCFMFGTSDPHRGYRRGSGIASGLDPKAVQLPPYLPDTPEVRSDVCDYYYEVQRFDREVGEQLDLLRAQGLLDNTIVVMTSDNGWPFPRGKANLYDMGSHVPLAVQWLAGIRGQGRVVEDFVSMTDFAPTFLQAAGLIPPESMTGTSLLQVFQSPGSGKIDPKREQVFLAKERHTTAQADTQAGTPMRGIRTKEFLYIRNYEPDRWPAGAPISVKGYDYTDIDPSVTKEAVVATKDREQHDSVYEVVIGKRPTEELYAIKKDPDQITNLADQDAYAEVLATLRAQLDRELMAGGDPRALGKGDIFDTYPYLSPIPDKR